MTNFYSENVCYMITRFQESLQVLRLIGHCISHNSFRKTLLNLLDLVKIKSSAFMTKLV